MDIHRVLCDRRGGGCGRSHSCWPDLLIGRRIDLAELIGEALQAKAAGSGHRRIAGGSGIPAGTVRGWLRRFALVASRLTGQLIAVAASADPLVRAPPSGDPLAVAVAWVGLAGAAMASLSGEPVYRQVADALRAAIRTGELVAGQRLPSETELIHRYGVSRNSVRTAVGLLRIEGLVVTEHGRGSFVRARRPLRRLGSPQSFNMDEGDDVDDRLLGVEVTDPPAEVADRLGLTPGELVLVRRHLLLFAGEPAGLVDRYFPLRVAQPAGAEQADRNAHAPAELERVVDELTVQMSGPEEARQLGMSGGVPVVRVLRTSYDASGSVLEVADYLLAGDRHVLVYEVPAG